MGSIPEKVKDEVCGNYIVVTNPSNELERLSKEELSQLVKHLFEFTFIYSNGCIYIHI